MNKTILLSLMTSTLLVAGGDVQAPTPLPPVAEPIEEDMGTVSGQLRGFYIDRTYSGSLENNRNSLAFGGWIGYDSPSWSGLSAGVKFYAVEGVSIHGKPLTSANYDPSLYGDGFESYGFIGEAYLNFKSGNTAIKAGRQKLNTPLAGADDARMLPNLFEAVVVSNSDIEDTTLILAHVTKESVGTFGHVYGDPSALSLQSGYGLGYKLGSNGDFATMGEIALGEGTDTDGVTAGAIIYKGKNGLGAQAWNYYAHDILNAIYLQADYSLFKSDDLSLKASAQYINQSDVGDALAGEVDSNYFAGKLSASSGNLSGYVAYSQTGDSDGSMNGGILSPWGGMPAFTQGMVTRHQFFADTTATKVAATYNLKELTNLNLKATGYYVSFDIGEANTYKPSEAWTADEAGFDLQYQATKSLNLRFRGNFPTDFAPGLDWAEYRLIANYNF
jgi:imipenem/basic amino acid-specific outer membrane pore